MHKKDMISHKFD